MSQSDHEDTIIAICVSVVAVVFIVAIALLLWHNIDSGNSAGAVKRRVALIDACKQQASQQQEKGQQPTEVGECIRVAQGYGK